ncbi:MAG: tRNA (guanosine(37)-N1)-methyltransferase TrmD [Thermodesulfobacteriaceae bacterium]|nr:tRNA (guanosine(37)-N1)-methyltransferase TrmD [Thermodesulfobacteriaceae bacterium]MDW8135916.1 tRNA (guanosine(37)-N1)-methyltransferase TrmD [Thermodesulfobacterium sp.]
MQFDILTIFPEYFVSPLKVGLLGKAIEKGLIKVNFYNLRDFSEDKHKGIDDVPYGGGEGMVFKPEPLYKAISFIKEKNPKAYVIYFSPQGKLLNQRLSEELSQKGHLVLICGRYEGIDERIRAHFVEEEISIGDYVVFGGEVASLVLIEVVSRLIPGVVGRRDSVERESFTAGLLKYPAYTRPREFMGFKVPEVLLSGNHAEIEKYRKKLSLELTLKKRPYLLASYPLSKEERNILKELLERQRLYLFLVHYPVLNKKGETIASAITNLDLHDLARLGRTYGVKGVYVIQPLEDQKTLGEQLVKYWLEGKGGDYNPLRKEAMKVIRFFKNLEEAIDEVQKLEGERPLLLGTDASPKREFISYEKVRELLWENPLILVLGTAWGLTEEVLKRCDYFLEPIWGRLDFYNHLSVRSAASILVDRILGVYSICKKI